MRPNLLPQRWSRGALLVVWLVLHGVAPLRASQDVEGRYGMFAAQVDARREPYAAAFLPDGRLAVLERGAPGVVLIGVDGSLTPRWGVRGDLPGQLERPSGLTATPEGTLLIADTGNHRVQEFTPDGRLLRVVVGAGVLRSPQGLTLAHGRLYVADTGNHRLVVLDREGAALTTIGEGDLRRPADVAVDAAGRVYVADGGHHRVVRFGPDGRLDSAWGERGPFPGLFVEPAGLAWHGDRLYVADRDNHRIQVFTSEGVRLYEWGKHARRPREGEGHLHYPDGVAVAPDGASVVVCESFADRWQVFRPAEGEATLYAADPALVSGGASPHFGPPVAANDELIVLIQPETQSVQVFRMGEPPLMITRFGGYGDGVGRFLQLTDVALHVSADEQTHVLVCDGDAGRVQEFRLERDASTAVRFDPAMAHLMRAVDLSVVLAAHGWGTAVVEPRAIARDAEHVYVADGRGRRVLVFDAGWRCLGVTAEGRDAVDLALGEDGRLWVLDGGRREVAVFEAGGGAEVASLAGEVLFDRPGGIAVGRGGRVVVTDTGRHGFVTLPGEDGVPSMLGAPGLGAGEFFKPRGVAWLPDGRLVVVDHGNHRAQLFEADGTFADAFGARLYVREARRSANR